MLVENMHLENLKEILDTFNIPIEIYQLLLEEYKNARAKIGISEDTYMELVECLSDFIEERIVLKE